jgi:6-pyruvoyltetrahydropterin/6-carboxytetrahydropterin synthase
VYELSIQTTFSAAHAIRIRGELEPLHGHNWQVTAVFSGEHLDADGLLVDFHLLERTLLAITAELHNRNLNETPPFSTGTNPTAELVARHLADELFRRLPETARRNASLSGLTVTEAPGCAATYRPSWPPPR